MIIERLHIQSLIYLFFICLNILTWDNSLNVLLSGLVMILLLEILCNRGLGMIAWLLLFVPLIYYIYTTIIIMTVIGSDRRRKVKEIIDN